MQRNRVLPIPKNQSWLAFTFKLLAKILLVACLASIAGLFIRPGFTKPFRPRDFEQVCRLIDAGVLVPDKDGQIRLPARYSNLTADGNVYVTITDQKCILFPSWIGQGTMLYGNPNYYEGFVYCKESKYLTQQLHTPQLPCGKREDTVAADEELEPNWYSVCPFD